MSGDSKKVYNKIFKKFNSLEDVCDFYLGKGDWDKEYPYEEGAGAFADFAREYCPLLDTDDFWIEEPDSNDQTGTIFLWCIFDKYTRKQIRNAMLIFAKKVEELTSFKMEWEIDEEENYVNITFKVEV